MAHIAVMFGAFIGLMVAEELYLPSYEPISAMYEDATLKGFTGIPKVYGAVILMIAYSSYIVFWKLGSAVGQARSRFQEAAKKEGKEDERNFKVPKLYAEGFSDLAEKFNCIQRGHQQALETHHIFLVSAIIGGVAYPVTCTIAGLLWCRGRLVWAKGYADLGAADRYKGGASAIGIWVGLFIQLMCCAAVGVKMFL